MTPLYTINYVLPMEIDKQLKAYYIIIATNTSSLFYLLSIQETIIKAKVELSIHFYKTMFTN